MGPLTLPSKLLISFRPRINTVFRTLINTWKVCKWPMVNSFVNLPYLNVFFSVSKYITPWNDGCNCSEKLCAPDMVFITAVSLHEFEIEQELIKTLQSQKRFDLKVLILLSLKAQQHFPGRSCGLVLNDLMLWQCLSPGWKAGRFNLSPRRSSGCFKLLWVLWAHHTSLHVRVHACVRCSPSPRSKVQQPCSALDVPDCAL